MSRLPSLSPATDATAPSRRRRPPAGRSPTSYELGPIDAGLTYRRRELSPRALLESDQQQPDVSRCAVIVARALLEVLCGLRPAGQLARWTSARLQEDLQERAPRRPTGMRLQLQRLRVSEPAAGVAEVCALAQDLARGRVRVIAMRLELHHGAWVVTRLESG